MNKIITASLLLLAGTALSQAATAVFAIGTTTSQLADNCQTTEYTGYATFVLSSCAVGYPATTLTSSTLDGFTLSYASTSTVTTSGKYWGQARTNNTYSGELAWVLHNVTGLSYSTLNSLLGTYNGACNGNTGYIQNLTFSGLTSGVTYTVALVVTTNGSSGSLSLSSGGTITSAYYGTVGGSSWDEATISSGDISISLSSSSWTVVALTFTATSESVSFGAGSGGYALAAITTDTVAIPEPSAFGLLAGLGALVLVASRRRRRRA